MNKPQLPVQQYVPEQTIQHYLDALLQDAADELARTDAEVAAPRSGTGSDRAAPRGGRAQAGAPGRYYRA
ncbi:hypothetical protein UMZ34_00730 [Halopseudomonas pachastrellae]|nr:hypothetical protein UMZ34_00730 [Halopseudomonas pachastrellae]